MKMSRIAVVLFLTGLLNPYTFASSGRRRRCREPSDHTTDFTDRISDGFYQVPPLQGSVANMSAIPEYLVRIHRSELAGDATCPTWEEAVRQGAGSCPFRYVLNTDVNRIPNTLVETQCNCAECLTEDGLSLLMDCQPVLYYTKVFRRSGCTHGVYRYMAAWEPLRVGCQCVPAHRRVSQGLMPRTRL